mgnify:FL=1
MAMGVKAIKIDGRQRCPTYVAQITRVWRAAIDQACATGQRFSAQTEADLRLARRLAEQQDVRVDAGDASALQCVSAYTPFVLRPHIAPTTLPLGWTPRRWARCAGWRRWSCHWTRWR